MDAHIKYLCCILFYQLRKTGKIHYFLSTDAANKLAVSLILSRSDYCNSLLAGIPDNKLNIQRIQNHAAQLVLHKSRHVNATTLLRTLHWLPVKAMIQCKLLVSVFCVSLSEQYATLYFWPSSSILSLLDTALPWHLSTDSSSFFSWDLWENIFLCFWTHCLEFTTTVPQKTTALYNF